LTLEFSLVYFIGRCNMAAYFSVTGKLGLIALRPAGSQRTLDDDIPISAVSG
jgi:hypothetical protein